ncbi:alpha/beta fold hydrolase [Micromonospora echinospora]|uniref:alpha/beta fold hydrolase n=1 Tax=Micromonospora echinospora TaxID=1877 RepID=UPI003A8A9A6E
MEPVARHLAGRHARVVAVDMPGHGGSPPPPDGYGVDRMADRLRAFAVALDLRDVVVVAHSLGGVWSLAAVAGDRDRFTGLALLDSAVAGPPAPPTRSSRPPGRCATTPPGRSGSPSSGRTSCPARIPGWSSGWSRGWPRRPPRSPTNPSPGSPRTCARRRTSRR